MGPQVKRLMDMGGRLEDIINLHRNYEKSMLQSGSGNAGVPMRTRDNFERPMNAAEGFKRQPILGYHAKMRRAPDYAGSPDHYAGLLDRYHGPPDGYYGPPDRYYCTRYRYDRPPDRYDGPPPTSRFYGRRASPNENSRSVWEVYELSGQAAPKQHSQKRAPDLLRKIWQDIEEECADGRFQLIPREIAGYETDDKGERRVRGGTLPQRTTSPRDIRDEDHESRRGWCLQDESNVPRRIPSPRRQPSTRRQESSAHLSAMQG